MDKHLSDCSTHNAPAQIAGECDCLQDRYEILVNKYLVLAIKYSNLADKYAELKKGLWGGM